MNDQQILTIAPLLRGLTFDGARGARVRPVAPPFQADLTIDALVDDRIAPQAIIDAVTASRQAYGALPAIVEVAGVGAFAITPPSAAARGPVAEKIAVVTGGAQGFGEEIVRGLVRHGAYVAIADLNLAGAANLADTLNAEQGREVALPVAVNVTDEASVQAMVAEIVTRWGGMDLFISNAGVLKAGGVTGLALKDFQFVTEVNYTGFFLCVKHVAPVMAAQHRAAGEYFTDIIQINSKSGLEGSNRNGAYAGSKFGGIGLVQSFALELIADNIKVNAICPGNFFEGPLWADPEKGLFVQYLRTGKVPGATSIADVKAFYEAKVPMKRGCRGEDVLKTILYVVEQCYETGQAIPVTGGQVMLS